MNIFWTMTQHFKHIYMERLNTNISEYRTTRNLNRYLTFYTWFGFVLYCILVFIMFEYLYEFYITFFERFWNFEKQNSSLI